MFRIVLALSACAILAASSASARPAPMATGSDAFGYTYVDSKEAGGPTMDWEEISGTGTALFTATWNNNQAPSGDFGFDFPLYGQSYRSCTVSSNGLLQFGTPDPSDAANANLPAAAKPGLIAPFWDDLQSASSGVSNVYVETFTTPTPHVVVEWYRARRANAGGVIIIGGGGGTGTELTFQVKLYADGTILMNYLTLTGSGTNGNNATVGIQGSGTGPSLVYLFNGNPSGNQLAAGTAIEFSVPSVAPDLPTGLEQAGASGGPAEPVGYISDSTLVIRGLVGDTDSHLVGLDVEILPSAAVFDPSLITGWLVSGQNVPAGQVAEVPVTFTGTPYGDGDFHWRVRSRDQFGLVSGWVVFDPAPVHVTVDLVAPGTPTLQVPADGSDVLVPSVSGGVVQFQWTAVTDVGPAVPPTYRLEIAKDAAFAQTVHNGIVPTATAVVWLPTSGFFYYWKVTAIDAAGNVGTSSATLSFRVVADDGLNHSSGDAGRNCGFAAQGSTNLAAWLLGALISTLLLARRLN